MRSLNSRERVLAAVNREALDRVPTDIWATGEVWKTLTDRFGSAPAALEALHIDGFFYGLPEYSKDVLRPLPVGEVYDYWGFWGIRNREVAYATGVYQEQCFYPLAGATTIDDLEQFPWPRVDWFDYEGLRQKVAVAREKQATLCGYMAPFYFHNLLRGLERSLMDPYDDPAFTRRFLDLACGFIYDHHQRLFEVCEGLIDVAQVTDDYGSQSGLLIGIETFREFYKPHMQRMIDLCHGFGIKVFHHDDGAMRPMLPELVDMGIDILNPVQHTCPGMGMEALKRDVGHRICFHGAVENQRILPFGTPDEVRAEVRQCIDALASDGTGFILAPCHNLQAVTPIDNIVAMYDEAHRYGKR